MTFIRTEYRKRGYLEVTTPNMYNMQLWETSGHAANYKENMFVFDIEKQEFGLKPMNCPGHCLIFDNRVRSYRELPLRIADFGVLHRNEASGALTGLTRVRRFQQDDAHIFCRESQIKDEVKSVLEFINYAYDIFGFTFELKLSTVCASDPLLLSVGFILYSLKAIASDSTSTPSDLGDFSNDDYSRVKGPEKRGYIRLVGRMPTATSKGDSSTNSQTIDQLKSVVNVMLNIIQEHIPNANLASVLNDMNIKVPATISSVNQVSSSRNDNGLHKD